jgi:hypothetical protein
LVQRKLNYFRPAKLVFSGNLKEKAAFNRLVTKPDQIKNRIKPWFEEEVGVMSCFVGDGKGIGLGEIALFGSNHDLGFD